MTDRLPLRCQQVGADLLTGPADADHASQIAAHIASCARCRSLSHSLEQDQAKLRRHLESAEWLPLADRVLAALPGRPAETKAVDWPRPVTRRGLRLAEAPIVPAPAIRRGAQGSGSVAASLRAACLVIVGLGLGLALHQVWPGTNDDPAAEATEFAATGEQDVALGGQPGTTDNTGLDASSAYVPAPGDNPPLVGSGSTVGITANQNRETWLSVRQSVQGEFSPVLYPPVPPGTFDSVVIESMAPDAFAVRYASDDMAIVMTAGAAASRATAEHGNSSTVAVRGATATLTVTRTTTPGQGGLRLDGQTSTALAAGTIVEVTWTETGDQVAVPYHISAAGLPVDLVMTFVDSLIPFGSGWDELRDALPAGTTIVTPGTLPGGFGAATLLDHSVASAPDGDGTVITYAVGYQRTSGDTTDRIVLSAAPLSEPAESGNLIVAGHPAIESLTPATTDQPATHTVTWTIDMTRYRIDFTGNGFTDADITQVLDGLIVTSVAPASMAAITTLSGTVVTDLAA